MMPLVLKIDATEQFPRLAHAPIAEAVIDIRARAEAPWEESAVRQCLVPLLPAYPHIESQREFEHALQVGPGQETVQIHRDLGWKGLRCESADHVHIAQFNRDGFVFSRLRPYDHWEQFHGEAMRLWKVYRDLARPSAIQRLGLRFINRIELPLDGLRPDDYLHMPADVLKGLPLSRAGFFHRDVLGVPGYPYLVAIVRTVQPIQVSGGKGFGLLLDIDVFSTEPFDLRDDLLAQRLVEMRWLKNKAFFGSITQQALETFQ
ncbi:TIGR04255 family protein [Candidatus Nitrospira inopinata]|jgi:uncharacterized protein (TIGR04255 family)|uniref:TIGR04255 family protein n=1 Tax=Candidatus Nitrospira inopinata TaxID=1715989 RepID=A0A0S4KPN2_9BACT|nr:TIGR04255 family protein [Candidatus Nitrospira inopinata]CUQ66311.1 conserved protein of unknown function [Candidatus Nitrospira inopinata]